MNVMLVDDEAPALAKLRRFLADLDDVSVVAEAGDGAAALAFVVAHPGAVDAVLLDIQMPGIGGLELAAALPPQVLVAFTTAFDEFAVQAFELNAVDYLLKPFTRERLAA
ncbi:MAG: response regulator, partial [Betaproteobacteria bacterium]